MGSQLTFGWFILYLDRGRERETKQGMKLSENLAVMVLVRRMHLASSSLSLSQLIDTIGVLIAACVRKNML